MAIHLDVEVDYSGGVRFGIGGLLPVATDVVLGVTDFVYKLASNGSGRFVTECKQASKYPPTEPFYR